jgi:Putative metallopeptidase
LGQLKLFRYVATLSAGVCLAISISGSARAASYKSGQIRVEYVLPKNSAHQPIYERLKQARALERIQTLLRPLRLPRPLLLKVSGCDGESNAWYDEGFVTVCYEYLADILKNAPENTLPSGITRQDAILGPFVDVFLHESGHAAFDLLKVPVLGGEEDAADFFSAYIMLQLGKEEARRIILGSAYQYKVDVLNPDVTLTKFDDEHGLPAQRFYLRWLLRRFPQLPRRYRRPRPRFCPSRRTSTRVRTARNNRVQWAIGRSRLLLPLLSRLAIAIALRQKLLPFPVAATRFRLRQSVAKAMLEPRYRTCK